MANRVTPQHKTDTDYVLFEQYKIFVESAEKVSFKRKDANNFYLAANTLIMGTESTLGSLNFLFSAVIFSIAGMIISFIWWKNILSYKKLNSAKFEIIQNIEERLPRQIFKEEENILVEKGYFKLTDLEGQMPIIFFIMHGSTLIFFITLRVISLIL